MLTSTDLSGQAKVAASVEERENIFLVCKEADVEYSRLCKVRVGKLASLCVSGREPNRLVGRAT